LVAEITIPSIGIAMTEALLLKWLKQPGDEIAKGDPVVEIETDKATMELESPADGQLGPHLFEPGAIVPVGTVIVTIGVGGEKTEEQPAVPSKGGSETEPLPPVSGAPTRGASRRATASRRPHTLSPRARRLAQERGEAIPRVDEETLRIDRFRDVIAAKVSKAWREIPHFAVTREIDAERMLAALDVLRAQGGQQPVSTVTDLLLRALALALQECDQGEGHVGLAVATPFGVVNPVVWNVLALDPAALARERAAAVERARAGRLTPEDIETVPPSTLSNLGAFGIDHFTGLIALGQTSLLTVGRAMPRVVADGERRISVRTTFHATLNSDHRMIDGAEAARLLAAFAQAVENMTAQF
jgi:pyruvate dehydrogenase E2 component (dihydrolipoamide acetyltransferase)